MGAFGETMGRVTEATSSPLQSGCLGAAVLDTVGFVGGFFGPMILAPSANQGPMLGIFITGPAGAVAGFIGGVAMALVRGRRSRG